MRKRYSAAFKAQIVQELLKENKPLIQLASEHGVARIVPPDDPGALGAELNALIADAGAREELAQAARAAAEGPFSWDRVAAETAALYEELLAGRR